MGRGWDHSLWMQATLGRCAANLSGHSGLPAAALSSLLPSQHSLCSSWALLMHAMAKEGGSSHRLAHAWVSKMVMVAVAPAWGKGLQLELRCKEVVFYPTIALLTSWSLLILWRIYIFMRLIHIFCPFLWSQSIGFSFLSSCHLIIKGLILWDAEAPHTLINFYGTWVSWVPHRSMLLVGPCTSYTGFCTCGPCRGQYPYVNTGICTYRNWAPTMCLPNSGP